MARKTASNTSSVDFSQPMDLKALFSGQNNFVVVQDSTWSKIDDYLPFGLPSLDKVFGGGMPFGRFVEDYAPENVGKSALAQQLTKMAVDMNCVIPVWFDVEGTADASSLVDKGINPAQVLLRQPTEAEMKKGVNAMTIERVGEAIVELFAYLEKKAPNVPILLIWDSIGQTPSEIEMKDGFDSERPGLSAKAITRLIHKVAPEITKRKVAFFGLNQARDVIGGMSFGKPIESTGGRALKHFGSVRLEMKKAKALEAVIGGAKQYNGHVVKINSVKSKISVPRQKSEIFVYKEHGFNTAVNAIYEAGVLGIMKQESDTNSKMKYVTNDGEIIEMKRLEFYDWALKDENFPIVKEIFTKVQLHHFPDWFPPLDNKTIDIEACKWYNGLRDVYHSLGKSSESLVVDASQFDSDEEDKEALANLAVEE